MKTTKLSVKAGVKAGFDLTGVSQVSSLNYGNFTFGQAQSSSLATVGAMNTLTNAGQTLGPGGPPAPGPGGHGGEGFRT